MIALIIVSASVAVLLTVWALCRAAAAGDASPTALEEPFPQGERKWSVMEAMCIVFVSPDWSAWVCCRRSCTRRDGPPAGRRPAAPSHQTDRRIEMSNIALSWAFRCHVGNASAKAVLVYLADRASDDGTAAFPKIETIVNVTELSERTVRSSLKLLQERGFIRRGDQRYARLGKGGRTRLPQYCQIVWDLAVESDPATLT